MLLPSGCVCRACLWWARLALFSLHDFGSFLVVSYAARFTFGVWFVIWLEICPSASYARPLAAAVVGKGRSCPHRHYEPHSGVGQ
jgi:hypothetical protein